MTASTAPASPAPAAEDGPPHADGTNPWVGLAMVLFGTVMVILDTTIVNVALPIIGDDLGAGGSIEWVVTAYLLGVVAVMPASGWLADRFGRKRVFLTSVAAFTGASLLCAVAPTIETLIAARALQGMGGGSVMPVGMAIVIALFPSERHGRALATWGMAAMVAPAVGPTLGGWLVTTISWHWLFLVNVPIGVVGVLAGHRLLADVGHRTVAPFDLIGLLTGAGGLALFVLGVSEGGGWGWVDPVTVTVVGAGLTLMAVFVHHARRVAHPILDVGLFRYRTFALAIAIALLVVVGLFGRLVFIPLQLEQIRGLSALRIGLVLSPAGVSTAVGMFVGGRLVDRIGPRLPVVTGCSLMATALFGLSRLDVGTPLTVIALILALQGLGMGVSAAPSTVAVVSSVPASLVAQASTMRSLAFQVGGAIGVAALGAALSVRMPEAATAAQAQAAYDGLFLGLSGLLVVAAVMASFLPGRAAREETGGSAAVVSSTRPGDIPDRLDGYGDRHPARRSA